MALVENVQRADLSFWEEAEGYRRLLTVYGLSREELCRRIGKSPAFLSNKLRLLKLDPGVRAAAEQGDLSERHVRCLLSLETAEAQLQVIERICGRDGACGKRRPMWRGSPLGPSPSGCCGSRRIAGCSSTGFPPCSINCVRRAWTPKCRRANGTMAWTWPFTFKPAE